MNFTVYIILCSEGRYYIGYTSNLEMRIKQHNNKESCWTSRYNDWRLVYTESYKTKTDALKREKYLKSLKNGNEFKKILRLGSSVG